MRSSAIAYKCELTLTLCLLEIMRVRDFCTIIINEQIRAVYYSANLCMPYRLDYL